MDQAKRSATYGAADDREPSLANHHSVDSYILRVHAKARLYCICCPGQTSVKFFGQGAIGVLAHSHQRWECDYGPAQQHQAELHVLDDRIVLCLKTRKNRPLGARLVCAPYVCTMHGPTLFAAPAGWRGSAGAGSVHSHALSTCWVTSTSKHLWALCRCIASALCCLGLCPLAPGLLMASMGAKQ